MNPFFAIGFLVGHRFTSLLVGPYDVLESPQNRSQVAGFQRFDQVEMNAAFVSRGGFGCSNGPSSHRTDSSLPPTQTHSKMNSTSATLPDTLPVPQQ
jgi:hypothetical protein